MSNWLWHLCEWPRVTLHECLLALPWVHRTLIQVLSLTDNPTPVCTTCSGLMASFYGKSLLKGPVHIQGLQMTTSDNTLLRGREGYISQDNLLDFIIICKLTETNHERIEQQTVLVFITVALIASYIILASDVFSGLLKIKCVLISATQTWCWSVGRSSGETDPSLQIFLLIWNINYSSFLETNEEDFSHDCPLGPPPHVPRCDSTPHWERPLY